MVSCIAGVEESWVFRWIFAATHLITSMKYNSCIHQDSCACYQYFRSDAHSLLTRVCYFCQSVSITLERIPSGHKQRDNPCQLRQWIVNCRWWIHVYRTSQANVALKTVFCNLERFKSWVFEGVLDSRPHIRYLVALGVELFQSIGVQPVGDSLV